MKTAEEILNEYGITECNHRTNDDIIDAMIEYADQFKPKWVPVDEFDGYPGQLVVVKGLFVPEINEIEGPKIGLVKWKTKDHSPCEDTDYYSMCYEGITEVFVIPKTV